MRSYAQHVPSPRSMTHNAQWLTLVMVMPMCRASRLYELRLTSTGPKAMGVVTKSTARCRVVRSTTRGGISLVVAPVSLAVMVCRNALRSATSRLSSAAAASASLVTSLRVLASLFEQGAGTPGLAKEQEGHLSLEFHGSRRGLWSGLCYVVMDGGVV